MGRLTGLLPATMRESYVLKITLSLSLVVAAIALVGFVVHDRTADAIRNDVQETLVLQSEAEARELSQWRTGHNVPARMVSQSQVFATGSRAEIRAYLRAQQNNIRPDEVLAIHYVRFRNQTVITSTRPGLGGNPARGELQIRELAFNSFDDVTITEPYLTDANRTAIAFITPVRANPGTVVTVVVNASDLAESFDSPVPETRTQVVDSEGRVIFPSGPSDGFRTFVDRENRTSTVLTSGLRGQSGVIPGDREAPRYRGQVLAYAPVEATDWVVVKRAPADRAFAVSRTVSIGLVSLLVVAVGGVVLFGSTIGRNTAQRVRELSMGATRIEEGEYDVDFPTDRRDELGDLSRSLASMRNALRERIADLTETRERLTELNQSLTDQRVIISVLNRVLRHNLRNEVHVIRGRAEQIQLEVGENENAAIIIARTERLVEEAEKARMVEDIVAGDIEPRPVDLSVEIDRLTESFTEHHPEVTFDVDLPETVIVQGNELLPRAFENLLENAIEHNDSDAPTVTVTATTDEDGVEVEIVDNGPGIPEQEAEIIEEGEESALRHSSGLGLWVSNWLVEEVDGELHIESTDDGTVAGIRLRAAQDPAGERTAESSAGLSGNGHGGEERGTGETGSVLEDD